MSWFPCPGCDRMVTALVLGTGPDDAGHYSKTHCCLPCQQGEGCHHPQSWGCAGIPGAAFRQTTLAGDMIAHYIVHVPDGTSALPAVLFLHGGVTYKYPESLWPDVYNLVEKNRVVRERFIVIAPFAAIGEPIAVVSSTRTTDDRFGNNISYVDDFNPELVWTTFMQACKALDGRVDWSRLSVVGYSMGGQSVWDLMLSHGSQLAAGVPFSGCCSWTNFDWNQEDMVLKQLEQLSIRSYNGMADSRTYSWRDFTWLAEKRGLKEEPTETEEEHPDDVSATVYEWDGRLQLCLMNGTPTPHCCWEPVFHNEDSFSLFTWLERQHLISQKKDANTDELAVAEDVETIESARNTKRKIALDQD